MIVVALSYFRFFCHDCTWNIPKTSIFQSCIIHWKPKSNQFQWIIVQKCSILVWGNLSSNTWLLENIHSLNHYRVNELQISSNFFGLFTKGHIFENLIMPMQGMAYREKKFSLIHKLANRWRTGVQLRNLFTFLILLMA